MLGGVVVDNSIPLADGMGRLCAPGPHRHVFGSIHSYAPRIDSRHPAVQYGVIRITDDRLPGQRALLVDCRLVRRALARLHDAPAVVPLLRR